MELSADHEAELKSVLAANPNGISYTALCEECYSFDSLADVSKALHQAVNLGIAYKEGKLYYDLAGYNKLRADDDEQKQTPQTQTAVSDQTPTATDPITEEIKKLLGETAVVEEPEAQPQAQPKVITSSIKRTVVAPLAVSDTAVVPINGNLRRTKSLGAAAMALYKFRKERALTLDDLSMLTGTAKTALSGVMSKLVDARYAVKSGSVRYPEFKWSNVFIYPFETYSTEDSSLVLQSAASWRQMTGQAANSAESHKEREANIGVDAESCTNSLNVVSQTAECTTPHAGHTSVVALAVQQIDMEINMCLQQIESLRRVRDRMCGLLK